jgi:hypothetical protein
MRWCDSDAQLTVTLSESGGYENPLVLAINVFNPSFTQMGNTLMLSMSGPSVYAAPAEILQRSFGDMGAVSPSKALSAASSL